MYCTKRISNDLVWVGGNDRRLAMFEGAYQVPRGVSYNAYLLTDTETVLFDTVDKAVEKVFFENLEHELAGRKLDYVVVHHMEPDHSATLAELLRRYPDVRVVCNAKILGMIAQFTHLELGERAKVVKEGDTLSAGSHEFKFLMAPMIHWPEVMMSYDLTTKTLFSADAFGTFGALNGAIFADEADIDRDWLDEYRRYYTNIVGKYGAQVQAFFRKVKDTPIEMICPLHGFVWRKDLGYVLEKYNLWSTYTPEVRGVLIAYASVYGNTENAAEILASRLRERGVKADMYDVSVTPGDEVLSQCFRWSHLVFAATTYNNGIFIRMEELHHDLVNHALQNRTLAFVENGSWAPASGKLMRELMGTLKGMTVLDETLSLRSSLREDQLSQIDAMAEALAASVAGQG